MITDKNIVYLSHTWGESCPAYANGKKVSIIQKSSILEGDSSNSLEFSSSNHIGTHFDFPLHFVADGRSLTDYPASFFVHKSVALIWLDLIPGSLVGPESVKKYVLNKGCSKNDVTLVLIRTGASTYRQTEDFWANGSGLDTGLAESLRNEFPSLSIVGVDSISITSFKHRELGRKVHKEFLGGDRPIVLIEDMNLDALNSISPSWVCALPLQIKNADGAPASIIAKI